MAIVYNYLLLETGGYLLLETGGRIIIGQTEIPDEVADILPTDTRAYIVSISDEEIVFSISSAGRGGISVTDFNRGS